MLESTWSTQCAQPKNPLRNRRGNVTEVGKAKEKGKEREARGLEELRMIGTGAGSSVASHEN